MIRFWKDMMHIYIYIYRKLTLVCSFIFFLNLNSLTHFDLEKHVDQIEVISILIVNGQIMTGHFRLTFVFDVFTQPLPARNEAKPVSTNDKTKATHVVSLYSRLKYDESPCYKDKNGLRLDEQYIDEQFEILCSPKHYVFLF